MTHTAWMQERAAGYYFAGLEQKRQKGMNWFLGVFLPSVASRIGNNAQYPNTCIVSDKQADILGFYMERDDNYRMYTTGNDGQVYFLEERGKWWVLRKK